jgi:hypothetical protein
MYLFDHSRPTVPQVLGEPAAIGNHIPLVNNMYNLFFNNFSSIDVINTVFIIGSTLYISFYFRKYSAPQCKALLMYLILIANILIFGLVNETRMLIILLPFLTFFQIEIDKIRSKQEVRLQAGNCQMSDVRTSAE